MTYFVAYDIANPKRLYKTAKAIGNYGERIQNSFFRCDIDKARLEALKKELFGILDMTEDSLKIYPVCSDCMEKSRELHGNCLCQPENYRIM